MKYMIKEDVAKNIKQTYRNSYFINTLGITKSYLCLVINRKKSIPKRCAFAFTKAINSEGRIEDYFDVV